jgi:nitronate monooxygenase
MGALPRANAGSFEIFRVWLRQIRDGLERFRAETGETQVGPVSVNFSTGMPHDELRRHLEVCRECGVEIVISAAGDPTDLIKQVHDWGGCVFHDVTNLRFAEKAIAAQADGLTCIGAGGGGHSGTISHLSFIPKVRAMFDGTIIMAGAVTTGAAVRAAEVLGADLAYMGTRFIATRESLASNDYKDMLVDETSEGLRYTSNITGVPANWLVASLQQNGLDPDALPEPAQALTYRHLPKGVRPWTTLWSAGQGIDLIDGVLTAAELVGRLRQEYIAACRRPDMSVEAAGSDILLESVR